MKALAKLAAKCGKDFAVDHAVKAVTSLAGLVSKSVGRFLEGRADPLLAVPDLMELGRGEVTGLGQGMFSAAGLDTRLTVIPARFMNFAEASALPTTDLGNFTECQAPPADVPLPAGAPPGIQCLAAVSADLDGDGQPDRLLVWESQPPDDIGGMTGDAPPQMGAVAYLDDGTFHLLEEAPSSWKLPGSTTAEELRPVHVVSLGDDRRQQVLVTAVVGANTDWQVVFIVGKDRRLHALKETDGTTVVLTDGGGVAYSSRYGCVDSSSRPLVAEEGTETAQGSDGLDHGYTWSIGYYRLLDLEWTHVATRTGKAASVRTHPRATVRTAAIRTPRIAGRRSGRRRAPLDNGHTWRRRSRPCHAIGPAAAEVAAEQGNRLDGQRNRSRPCRPWPRVLLSAARASLPGSLGARTGGGQQRPRIRPRGVYVLVRGLLLGQRREVCKTVGSAYVGSNPTPATTVMSQDIEDTANLHRVRGVFFGQPGGRPVGW